MKPIKVHTCCYGSIGIELPYTNREYMNGISCHWEESYDANRCAIWRWWQGTRMWDFVADQMWAKSKGLA